MTDTPYDTPAGKTLERLVNGRLDSLEQGERELHSAQAEAANLRVENSTLRSERDLLLDEAQRSRPLVEAAARWGIPTVAIVNNQGALQTFEANAADKIGKKDEMTSMSATANPGLLSKPRVAQVAVVIAAIVVSLAALWFTLTHVSFKITSETPVTTPPAVQQPMVPKVTTPWAPWDTLPALPADPTTRLEEASHCPATTNPTDIEYFTSTSTSFDEYKSWLHDTCGIDTVLADDTTYRPEWTDFSDVQQGPLTDEQVQELDQMTDQVLNH